MNQIYGRKTLNKICCLGTNHMKIWRKESRKLQAVVRDSELAIGNNYKLQQKELSARVENEELTVQL